MAPRTGLVLALVAAVLIMGQFASLVEGKELDDCTLTDVDGVQTLVIGSDITIIPELFCENVCGEGGGMEAIDFSGATSLVEIRNNAFGSYHVKPCTETLKDKLDLSNLPELRLIGTAAFAMCKKITSVDISNCPNLGALQDSAFTSTEFTSFVAKNVGTTSDQSGAAAGCTSGTCWTYRYSKRYGLAKSTMSGALMIAANNFPSNLELLDFRGTAVGSGRSQHEGKWAYPERKWFFNGHHGNDNPDTFALWSQDSAEKRALFSYKKCEVEDGELKCCTKVNGNDFEALSNFGGKADLYGGEQYVGRDNPSDTCAPCAANCDSCDTAGAGKCDTCSTGYSKTADDTCEDIDGCAGNPACGADATCVDVAAPGTGYECQCDDGFLGDPVQNGNATCQAKAKCSEWSANSCSADQQVLSDTLFCQDTACTSDDGDTCCVARANCSTITCAAGTEAKTTSAASQLCAGATCDSATDDNDLCCQEIDGCAASPDCGTNATCADVEAPGTGHECRCDDGFTGTTTTDDTAATCTPVQLGGAALPSTSSAAVWIVSSIFASVFAVSSCGA